MNSGAFHAMSLDTPGKPVGLMRGPDLRLLIQKASDQLCQVVDGDLDFVVQVSEADDDFDKLLLLINFVLASARRSFADLREVHQRMAEDLSAARKLQEKLLPQTLPDSRNLRLTAKCLPARAVGGDFFDFGQCPNSELHVGLLADVSGKGAAAAIFAGLASGIARSLVHQELNPDVMLSKLNETLFMRAPEGNFVALTYYTWDDAQLVLELSNSGLPEPLLCRGGKVRTLPVHGLPLGLFPVAEYEAMRIQCEPGDTLLFYTDGVVDSVDMKGNEFGTERLIEIVKEACQHNPADIVNEVFDRLLAHCPCEMIDDQTVIVMQVL